MSYIIYKLKFKGFTHFGETDIDLENVSEWVGSDTLFSAWLNTVKAFWGNEKAKEICQRFLKSTPPFRISSLFVFNGNDYFLPRPLSASLKDEISKELGSYLKKFKKVKWISHTKYALWLKSELKAKDIIKTYDIQEEKYFSAFEKIVRPRVALDRETMESNLYHVGYLKFTDNAGLWGIAVGTEKELDFFKEGLSLLGEIGLGGEKTYGCGQFEVEFMSADEHLKNLFNNSHNYPQRVLISRYIPTTSELNKIPQNFNAYRLDISRGWITSGRTGLPIKRKSVRYICEGSTFQNEIKGKLVDITPDNIYPERLYHKVYRYGLALYLPLPELKNG